MGEFAYIGVLAVVTASLVAAILYGVTSNVKYECYFLTKSKHSLTKRCDFTAQESQSQYYNETLDIQHYKRVPEHDPYYSRNVKFSEEINSRAGLPDLLPNYRNPCWYERIPDGFSYLDPSWSLYYSLFENKQELAVKKDWHAIFCPVEQELSSLKNSKWRLRCFPRYFLLGFPKCGTTDLYVMTLFHPAIINTKAKEPEFWNDYRFLQIANRSMTLSDYLDLYDQTSDQILHQFISTDGDHREYHPGIFGDCDPKTVCDFRVQYPASSSEPRSTTADVIHSIYPEAKLIVMMRNPVDRFISHFRMFHQGKIKPTPQQFHTLVQKDITEFEDCVAKYSLRYCAYHGDHDGYIRTSLTYGMYEVFLADWLKLFPKEQFLFIKSENYFEHRPNVMGKVFDFLELSDVSLPDWVRAKYEMTQTYNVGHKDHHVLDETRELLKAFYKPHNERLIKLLGYNHVKWDN